MPENEIEYGCCDETEEEDVGTIVSDVYEIIRRQRRRDLIENGAINSSNFESYSLLLKAIEDKDAASKDLKDLMKQMWSGVKQNDDGVVGAYAQELCRVAERSITAWIVIAALAQKADDTALGGKYI